MGRQTFNKRVAITRSRKSTANPRRIWFISAVKEWGGVGTLLIAIAYTFPTQVFDRLASQTSRAEQHQAAVVLRARQSLNLMAELRAERAQLLALNTANATYQQEIVSSIDIRVYNAIYVARADFRQASKDMTYSELYMIGSSLTIIGLVDEAQEYYQAALKAADIEGNVEGKVTIFREMGASFFGQTKFQDIPLARESFLSAIDLVIEDPSPAAATKYVYLVVELVASEIGTGNIECGSARQSQIDAMLSRVGQKLLANDNFLIQYWGSFRVKFATPLSKSAQCPYVIPSHPLIN